LETKAEETDYLIQRLEEHGVSAKAFDVSLKSGGTLLDGTGKLAQMDAVVAETLDEVTQLPVGAYQAVIGLGGGTGGEIALRILRGFPITFPKVLITTLPFDPRMAMADSSIVIVPTLADICGLNATLREVLENAAAMTAGLCGTRRKANACVEETSVGITGLGATDAAVSSLVAALRGQGQETTVFHSNGYGGAAFARFADRGAFHAIIDLTPHEITRLHLIGAHVPMPNRFIAGDGLPRIMLPGGLNFVGLGQKSLAPKEYLDRPHYEHSGFFTHAKVVPDEMRQVAGIVADTLNAATGAVGLIVPMGGFSHQDRLGGAIEDPELRQIFLDTVRAALSPNIRVEVTDAHIGDAATTDHITQMLHDFTT
jgi:uncharacterized protein (UPF0261 family)